MRRPRLAAMAARPSATFLSCAPALLLAAPAHGGTGSWSAGGGGLHVAPDGTVVTTDFSRNLVQRYASDGTLLSQWGVPGSGAGQLRGPIDSASAPDGDVYVVDSAGGRVQRFTAGGGFVSTIGADGCVAGEVAAGSGAVYVAENACTNGHRVRKLDSATGAVLGTFPQPSATWGLATAPSGDVYAASNDSIRRTNAAGDVMGIWTVAQAVDVSVDPAGVVYVLVRVGAGSRIDKFSADGAPIGSFTMPSEPASDVAAGADGLVFVGASVMSRIMRIDPSTPTAGLTIRPVSATQGARVELDASASVVPFAAPSRFEWDTDGDGTFETDTGATPSHALTYPVRRNLDVSVRVTAPSGATDVAKTPLVVGPPGVTVNDGAQFTNTPNVTVSAVWPLNATDFLASNDGGFTPATHFAVAARVPWRLNSNGPERLPKTVYVRFAGGSAGNETYQDDIILDQTRPRVVRAVTTPARGGRKPARAARKKTPTYRIALNATDNVSGVISLQVTSNRRKPGPSRRFARALSYKGKVPVYVRVRDRANNDSKWVKIKQPTRKKSRKR